MSAMFWGCFFKRRYDWHTHNIEDPGKTGYIVHHMLTVSQQSPKGILISTNRSACCLLAPCAGLPVRSAAAAAHSWVALKLLAPHILLQQMHRSPLLVSCLRLRCRYHMSTIPCTSRGAIPLSLATLVTPCTAFEQTRRHIPAVLSISFAASTTSRRYFFTSRIFWGERVHVLGINSNRLRVYRTT